ncbi:hypothetical protein OX90_18580 [Pseudomonas coronafaciens pv. porri]|uniref:Prophage PSSB64-02 n=1 Tax=Pseudomonas coronafaciens pv. porri TaxID=83964 RepID=A0ABR5JKT4_9PSED|nr:hypothetical protein [Pseudomonas coronafaciens]KOP55342.1 hypothetical protein OX90_18580 [Pseudomonas coronafaciens pv. porri]KOP56319.1 hypothetical protein OX88_11160 [Pseudomonas coronafaciens pv. porri]RMV91329.1 hypothetical protein ALP00_01772 [Pseudomonas coronafaciens pv. porri]RMW01767.1 hypothetical protein ALO99_04195 [Pseudomonas coronafaciens pv. porri]
MALTPQKRNERTALKRQKAGEEELRLRVRPGTKQALIELMEWASIEEQGEALTLMIHHLHSLGPRGALPMLEVPRHEITVSPVVARKLELAYEREKLRIVREA